MTNTSPPKPRKLTALELSAPARGALRRLKAREGMSFTHAVERGLLLLSKSLLPQRDEFSLPEPQTDAERAALGLPTGPRRVNRKRGSK